jgi:uroporphyrinogen-III synthase
LHILFTRPEIDSVEFVKKFIQLGHRVSIFPILTIVKKKIPTLDLTKYNSIIFTSANAVLSLEQEFSSNIRCFCVGNATALQAKKKGFSNIVTAGGSYFQLREIIFNHSNTNDGKFLYIRGEYIANDLRSDLVSRGYQVDSFITYTTLPNIDFDPQTLQILNDQIVDIIFIYSRRSADHFVKLIINNNLQSKCNSIQLRSISENVLVPLKKIKWKNIKMFSPGSEEFCLD